MPTLVTSPNPAPPSSTIMVSGTGFANQKTRLLLDGAGATTNIFRPTKSGTFTVGINVSSTEKTQTLVAQQQSNSNSAWTEVARISVVVKAAVVVPPPPPPPPVIVPVPPPPPAGGYATAPTDAVVFPGDATGQTDVSNMFANFISANVGKAVAFKPQGKYLMDNRTQTSIPSLDLYGQAAGVKSQGFWSAGQPDSWLRLVKTTNIHIRDIDLAGPASLQDVTDNYRNYGWGRENWRGIIIDGGHDIVFDRVKAHNFWGDCLYVARRDGPVDSLSTPDRVTLNDCDFRIAGRNAVSMVAGYNLTVNSGYIGDGGLCAWDTEPNLSTDITTNVHFNSVHFGAGDLGKTTSASHDSFGNGYAVMVSAGQAPAKDYYFDNCLFEVGSIYVVANGGRNSNISIKNSKAVKTGNATFANTDNITFLNNTNIIRTG